MSSQGVSPWAALTRRRAQLDTRQILAIGQWHGRHASLHRRSGLATPPLCTVGISHSSAMVPFRSHLAQLFSAVPITTRTASHSAASTELQCQNQNHLTPSSFALNMIFPCRRCCSATRAFPALCSARCCPTQGKRRVLARWRSIPMTLIARRLMVDAPVSSLTHSLASVPKGCSAALTSIMWSSGI